MPKKLYVSMRLGIGFFATISAAIIICVIAVQALLSVKHTNEIVLSDYAQDLIDAGRLRVDAESAVSSSRGYIITSEPYFLQKMKAFHKSFNSDLAQIRARNNFDPDALRLLDEIKAADIDYQKVLSDMIKLRGKGEDVHALIPKFEHTIMPQRLRAETGIDNYSHYCRDLLTSEERSSEQKVAKNLRYVILVSIIALTLAISLAILLTRTLSKLYRRVEEAVQNREEIVEVVSHDLKNPLAAIILNTELLKRVGSKMSEGEIAKKLDSIHRSADRMKNLIYGLLDLSKMKAGSFVIEARPCKAIDVLNEITAIFNPLAAEKGISLSTQVLDPNLQAFCDEERILQVLSNLGGNAIKFTPPGGNIVFSVKNYGRNVLFSVSDSGPGIPQEQVKFIFSRYWQAGPRSKEGAGLGLAIAKGIVEAHGGRIWVNSSVGLGTTFSFILHAVEEKIPLSKDDELPPIPQENLSNDAQTRNDVIQ